MGFEARQDFLTEEVLTRTIQETTDTNPLRRQPYAEDYSNVAYRLVRGAIHGKRLHLGEPEKGYRDLESFTDADGSEIQLSRKQKPYFYIPGSQVEGWPGGNPELGQLYVCGSDLLKLQSFIFTDTEKQQILPILLQKGALFYYSPFNTEENDMLVRMEDPDKGVLVPVDTFESGDVQLSIGEDDHHNQKVFMTKQFLLHPAKIELALPKSDPRYFEDRVLRNLVGLADSVGTQMTGWDTGREGQLSARRNLVSQRVKSVVMSMSQIGAVIGK